MKNGIDRVPGMYGAAIRWEKVNPKAVVAGSRAQAENVLADAKHDIKCLWNAYASAAAEVDLLKKALAETLEGLKPFAKTAAAWSGYSGAERLVEGWPDAKDGQTSLEVNDLRSAAAIFETFMSAPDGSLAAPSHGPSAT